MKTFKNILIILFISIILTSCGANTQTEEHSNNTLNTPTPSTDTLKPVDDTSSLSFNEQTVENDTNEVADVVDSTTTTNKTDAKSTPIPKTEDISNTPKPSSSASPTTTNNITSEKTASTPAPTPAPTVKPVETPTTVNTEKTVTISVKGIDNVIVPKTSVKIKDGDTVYDVLVKVLDDNGVSYSSRGSKKNKYIEGIDGLFEFDHGPKSGFVYEVNGVYASQSSSSFPLNGNENIVWYYTK